MTFRHLAEPELDTPEEQATALLHDLRESFSPSYLTLISIIEGVLLGLTSALITTGHTPLSWAEPSSLLVINNFALIVIVWNEYRMGSSMFRWVPSLPDAVIPFMLGGFQAVMIRTVDPVTWLGWLAAFYAAAIIAYHNMYRRSAEEERNAFVLAQNRGFQRLNLASCLLASAVLWLLFAYHSANGCTAGWLSLALATLINVGFMVRGEANWRAIVAATRAAAAPPLYDLSGRPVLRRVSPRGTTTDHEQLAGTPATVGRTSSPAEGRAPGTPGSADVFFPRTRQWIPTADPSQAYLQPPTSAGRFHPMVPSSLAPPCTDRAQSDAGAFSR
jgi:hypothetical protein